MAARRTKRTDGRYTVTITQEGKRLFFYGRTQAEARAKADLAKECAKIGAPVRDATRSLSEWMAEWVETCLETSNRARSTKTMHAGYCRVWIEPILGDVSLGKLRPADVTRLMLAMQDAGKADSTRRNCMDTMSAVLDDAVVNGLLAVNRVAKVKRPVIRRDDAQYLTPSDVSRFLAGAEGLRYAAALRLILGTGLRRGEALALRWADVNLVKGELRVHGVTGPVQGSIMISFTKTSDNRRSVSLSPSMVSLLKSHRAAQATERLAAANLWNETDFVFATEMGNPMDPQNLLRATKMAAQKLGLTGVTVHGLRHTYATTVRRRWVRGSADVTHASGGRAE
jgi:integrase